MFRDLRLIPSARIAKPIPSPYSWPGSSSDGEVVTLPACLSLARRPKLLILRCRECTAEIFTKKKFKNSKIQNTNHKIWGLFKLYCLQIIKNVSLSYLLNWLSWLSIIDNYNKCWFYFRKYWLPACLHIISVYVFIVIGPYRRCTLYTHVGGGQIEAGGHRFSVCSAFIALGL